MEYETVSHNGWQLLRGIAPPWRNLNDPLLHYATRDHQRTGGRPLAFIIIIVLTIAGLIAYLALQNTLTQGYTTTRERIESALFIVFMGLCLMSVLGHWRLLLATTGRSTAAIAQKRERGDWDLIYITPVSKSRWFRAQITALGWQVFPLVRRLMIVHAIMIVIAFPILMVFHSEEGGRVSPLLYALELLPFAALWFLEPLISAGIFLSSTLVESSLRKRTWVAFLNGLGTVYLMRVAMAFALVVGGFILLVGVIEVAVVVGLEDEGADFGNLSANEIFLIFLYGGASILVSAFVIEWILPGAGYSDGRSIRYK